MQQVWFPLLLLAAFPLQRGIWDGIWHAAWLSDEGKKRQIMCKLKKLLDPPYKCSENPQLKDTSNGLQWCPRGLSPTPRLALVPPHWIHSLPQAPWRKPCPCFLGIMQHKTVSAYQRLTFNRISLGLIKMFLFSHSSGTVIVCHPFFQVLLWLFELYRYKGKTSKILLLQVSLTSNANALYNPVMC